MRRLTSCIRSRSAASEILFVCLFAFGILLARQAWHHFYPAEGPPIDRARLLGLLAVEIPVLLVVGWVLSVRGWTLRGLGLAPTLGQTLLSLAFVVATIIIWTAVAFVLAALGAGPPPTQTPLVSKDIGWPTIIGVSLVNGIFEEVFLCGYLITALRGRFGLPLAVGASVAVRVLLHVYQGPVGMLNMAGMGLLFAWWFARTGKLWPLVVAHILLDVIALALAN
jgi:membrane protease YdiL (CAAX protease family)